MSEALGQAFGLLTALGLFPFLAESVARRYARMRREIYAQAVRDCSGAAQVAPGNIRTEAPLRARRPREWSPRVPDESLPVARRAGGRA